MESFLINLCWTSHNQMTDSYMRCNLKLFTLSHSSVLVLRSKKYLKELNYFIWNKSPYFWTAFVIMFFFFYDFRTKQRDLLFHCYRKFKRFCYYLPLFIDVLEFYLLQVYRRFYFIFFFVIFENMLVDEKSERYFYSIKL